MRRARSTPSQLPLAWCLVLLAGAPGLPADDPRADEDGRVRTAADRGWTCSLCPRPGGLEGKVDAGAGWVSDASPKFGDYRGLAENGGYAAVDGDVRFRGADGRFLDVRMRDLGIDSRSLDVRGGRRGRFTLDLAYREIPKYRGFGTETVYAGVGGNRLSLPLDWRPADDTGGMTGLAGALQPTALNFQRKILDVGLHWRLGPRWSYDLHLQHQRKEGTRPFGAGVFTIHSSHFPAPVDFSTNRLDLGLNYAGERASGRIGFAGSIFDNAFDAVTWPNPFSAIPGTERLRASLEPDNSFYRFDLAGAWTPVRRLRLSGSAAVGRMEQDEPLLPWTTNPQFSELPLPRLTAATRIDTALLNLAGRVALVLSPRLDLAVRLRHDERDNDTPVHLWSPVITDLVQREPRPNRPYSFDRDRASLSLRYRAHRAVRLRAGADHENYERSLQSLRETEETGYWGELGLTPGSLAELRLRLEHSVREGAPYLRLEDGGPVEHPLMRKFHLADRRRDRLRVDLDVFAATNLTLGLSYRRSEDDYHRSAVGLREAEASSLSLDAGWSISERVHAQAFATIDGIDSGLAGAESAMAEPWLAITEDRFLTVGLGVRRSLASGAGRVLGRVPGRGPDRAFVLGFDLVRSESEGDIRVTKGPAGGAFPTLETDLWNLRLSAECRLTERWGAKAYLEYEKYDSSDWALDGLGPDGIPAILTFGAESPDYDVTVVRLQASYRF